MTGTPPTPHVPARQARQARLYAAALAGDEPAATAVVQDALADGADPEDVLLDLIAPVQRTVGEEWAAARITVAQEHAASAVNERVIGALVRHAAPTPAAPRPGARPRRVTVACVDGEWHALPARLLTEVLRLRGWEADFLGAQVPTPRLVEHVNLTGPRAVALSGSLATRLPTAHAAIAACQAVGVPVLAGGAAFGPDGRYARLLGADMWAPDARAAAVLLAEHEPTAARRPHPAAPPHLADQEYTLVARSAPQLVRATLAGLEGTFPAFRDYSARQRRHTAEDIAQIVDFLAASLYADDPRLLVDFLRWTADVLTARGVPAHALTPTLDVLAARLADFPRAVRHLSEGRWAVSAAPSGPAGHSGHSGHGESRGTA
ncbi:cobalamin B12-binding domain-containing protein [Streptomyces avicenniae]|uniref:cobalamin B12-binding domain-containing protein n=1 Tax=Streptomyces avicenniae TaxID=500153 RepID=UPI00069A2529|nr:B12-binding domain-containing protein [Streptomyces avicenniae]